VLGVLFLLACGSAWAQTSSVGTVSGQVTDEQGAVIPGAEVKLTDTGTGATQTTVSNDAGRFTFASVPPGKYNVSFSKQGFSTFQVAAQNVQVGQVLTLNAQMKVGQTATTVEVTATAGADLQTMNATVGNTLDSVTMLKLPNLGRDVTSLAVLQPATSPTGYTAGSYQDANTYTLDGGNITDDMGGNTISYQTNYSGLGGSQGGSIPSGVVPTPLESIEEFKVAVSNQTSDFASSSGAQIQMVTKRGQNQFHGAGYWYYFDTAVGAANSWTNNHTAFSFGSQHLPYTPIISNHRNRFGGALGGPLVPKDFLGKKWYFFVNYEGMRFPNQGLYSGTVPSAMLRAGVIQVQNASGVYVPYNLNPVPVTVNGTTYNPAACPTGLCDPRGIGINPIVNQIWSKFMPLPNNPLGGDNYNTQGYLGTIRTPQTSNNYVARIDHDFNDKWHWYLTYRDYKLVNLTSNQVDIGGYFPGDTLGTPAPVAPRPQQPSIWTSGMTTTINPSTTNTFVFSYLRQFWQWGSQNGPPQLPTLGGALEIGGESTSALIPYNVNTQSIRQRFWDGQDTYLREDLTWIKGKHLVQYGGAYQHNFDYHTRTDNGVGINDQIVYQITSANINWANSPYIPSAVPSSQASNYESYYSYVLGLVSQPQVAYTRSGNALNLQPVGTPAFDKSTIPYYDAYFSDTWKVKPNLTLSYSLGYTLEMPPTEQTGKQVALVDSADNPIALQDFLAQRKAAALAGTSYTPNVGFALVGNVGSGLKYPYNPFYNEWSPRVSAAWNPQFKDGILGKVVGNGLTVVRGGYSRIWGRLNGVNQVLTPLLGVGLIQAVTCQGASSSGQCLGTSNVDPSTAFRIGVDGNTAPLPSASSTLAQPFFPGVNGNATAGDTTVLDPHYKPQRTDNFTISIQRQLSPKTIVEVGYIGRIIKNETMETDIDAVPYMTTLGGQSFASAYANVYQAIANGAAASAIPAQAFFENALGGASSSTCKAYSSCTAYVASVDTSLIKNTQVSDLWNSLNKQAGWERAAGKQILRMVQAS
jgi:hypothetical protein